MAYELKSGRQKLSSEQVAGLHRYWKARKRRVSLVELYESPARATRCPFADVARDAMQRMVAMGIARQLPAMAVEFRGQPRRECWELL